MSPVRQLCASRGGCGAEARRARAWSSAWAAAALAVGAGDTLERLAGGDRRGAACRSRSWPAAAAAPAGPRPTSPCCARDSPPRAGRSRRRPAAVSRFLDVARRGGRAPASSRSTRRWFAAQHRVLLERCGVVDPGDIADAIRRGAYRALARARSRTGGPERVIEEVRAAGLQGRGGAYFQTAVKWEGCRAAARRAQVHRRQRRGGRARHLQGPPPDGGRSAPAARRRAARGLRGRAPRAASSTSTARPICPPRAWPSPSSRRAPGASLGDAHPRLRLLARGRDPARRSAASSWARRRRCSSPSRGGAPCRARARRFPSSPGSGASRPSSTTSRRSSAVPVDRRARRRLVRRARPRPRHQAVRPVRSPPAAGGRRDGGRRHAARR